MAGGEQGNGPMTLCAGHCHVYRANATRCDCGAQANNPPIVGMYPFPAGYNPHHPRMQPPAPVAPKLPEPEIAASVKMRAIEAGATHLSADGLTGYRWRMGRLEHIHLDSTFPSWWWDDEGELPCGVVEVK